MPKTRRKKSYHSPESLFIMPDQLAFFNDPTVMPDPVFETNRRRACTELGLIADRLKTEYRRTIDAIKRARGDDPQPGEDPPPASRPKRPWRLRAGSNMEIVATMLEAAGRKGVSESEMVERLRERGRLPTASQPLRSVHWTVYELRRRTMNAVRKDGTDGARWYAYGNFNEWRGPAA